MMSVTELATFGGGCFWGTEAAFRKVKGVVGTTVGYMGGHTVEPSYEDVIGSTTGHAEVVRISFDPAVVSYEQLLELFWFIHDPTQRNRQGNDVGDQYRSVIFTHSNEQQKTAEVSKKKLQAGRTSNLGGSIRRLADRAPRGLAGLKPIVTLIEPAGRFYAAEDYHQRYLDKNPSGYCHINLHSVDRWLADHHLTHSTCQVEIGRWK